MTKTVWGDDDDADYSELSNQNVASDNSHVDQQIGVIYGDAAFHRTESVYQINQGDPPDRKHEVALNHLEAGNSRPAEEMLDDLLRNGHATSERAYYYVLAVLSGRSLNEIHGDVSNNIVAAYRTCNNLTPDSWHEALDVVWQLLWSMHDEIDGRLDSGHLQDTLDKFLALPSPRQAEITRHLDMVLSGVIQHRLDAADAKRVVTERMEPNRVNRAWKFFQPDPAQPRKAAVSSSKAEAVQWRRVWGGGLLFVIGMLSLLSSLGQISAVLGAMLLGVGGYLTLRHGVEREVLKIRLRRKELEHQPPATSRAPASPGHWVSEEFIKQIHAIVDKRFREARPHVDGDWARDTAGIRAHLKTSFVDLYSNAHVTPSSVSWLIRWHAKQIAAEWRSGSLFDYRAALTVPQRLNVLFFLGGAVASVGLLALLSAEAGGAALFLGLGGFFLGKGLLGVLALPQANRHAQREADRLYEKETHAYNDWVAQLADRPTDAEMARWLAMDKAYLKAATLRRLQLANHDLVAHIVMTEGAPGAMRARVLHGPPRYSTYVVLIFLLTKSGVRQMRVDLDFLQGKVHNERRNAFRYEALASASVQEKGIRIANNHQSALQTADDGAPLEIEHLRSRSFRLTLVSGENISVVMENFRNLSDAALENESELLKIALQTSGIAGALHVLETVAAEGPDWITREQERRERWSKDWYDGANDARPDRSDFVTLIADPQSNTDR
jgi:hypothetical protein